MLLKLFPGEDTINIISVYAPQIGLEKSIKKKFWKDMDEVIKGIPNEEKIFFGGDLNGYVGKDSEWF